MLDLFLQKYCLTFWGHFKGEPASLETLLETACNMGFLEEDIYLLLEEGFDESEIEALLNSPAAFYDSLADAAYARIDG